MESLNYHSLVCVKGKFSAWKKVNCRLTYRLERELFSHASAVLFASQRNLDLAKKWLRRFSSNWHICPQGVNDLTMEICSDSCEVRDQFATPRDASVLLTVSELTPNKNTKLIIDALAACKNKRIWLWIAGDGSERQALESRAQLLGVGDRVKFLGFFRSVADLYATADVFVLASERDTFPHSYLEAMVSGLPLLGPRHCPKTGFSAVDEIMTEGVSGFTFRQHDASDLAERIDFITSQADKSKEMGQAARVKALSEYSWLKHAERVLQIAQDASANVA
jgi:glycosyltransferase involved in cell wall biosynthesis